MSVSAEEKVSCPRSEDALALQRTISKSPSRDSLDAYPNNGGEKGKLPEDNNAHKIEANTFTVHPMAFTIDFGGGKQVDKSRLEELAKKSQARHQRVQSMSASMNKTANSAQKPPMSVKLPRKAQGYNSEGYFSSDQEDSCLSGSVKLRQSPIAHSSERTNVTSPLVNRHTRLPIHDAFQTKRVSKSPIVDSIMSRSDICPSRGSLNLPLKSPHNSYRKDMHRNSSFGNLSSSYGNLSNRPLNNFMADIIDQSPEGVMLTDISSPELDVLTPDNGLSTPELRSPIQVTRRAVSEMPDLVSKSMLNEPLYIDDDIDRHSNSSTGTYTIEADTYTEEQKARMSIDRTGASKFNDSLKKPTAINEKDPELIFDYPTTYNKKTPKESLRDICLQSPLSSKTIVPSKVSNEKNVLEISCCYESPTEDLAAQTSKQIKSTRSYLEKLKSRVKTITEKTFAKSPPTQTSADMGNFTSVTTSGVLSSKKLPRYEVCRRRCSLTKSEIDQTDYVHRLTRETSVPVNLPSCVLDGKFESSAMKNAQKCLNNIGVDTDLTSENVVGKLSHMSFNRCKGDKAWIHDWAESVKKFNNKSLESDSESNNTFTVDGDKPPISPRRDTLQTSARSCYSTGSTPTKIPSPAGTIHLSRRTPDLIPSTQDTEAYLQKTQNAITNLQAKLHSRNNSFSNIPPYMTSSLASDKLPHPPPSQLSRSNSLNYRLRRKIDSNDSSPLRNPGNYVITGSQKLPESTKILLAAASRSLDTGRNSRDSNMNSPNSVSNSSDDKTLSNLPQDFRKSHSRHRSFDGRNAKEFFGDCRNANPISLKNVLKNNAETHLQPRIDQTCYYSDKRTGRDSPKTYSPLLKRSSSFNTVTKNNNLIDRRINNFEDYAEFSDDSEHSIEKPNYKTNRTRVNPPCLKSKAPANSPRCQNTPEMTRKFGPGLVRSSVRVTTKERALNARMSEPPMAKEERGKPANHQSRRTEASRQDVMNRLTKSRSSTRETQPKHLDKALKKPAQYRSSSALASKEAELSRWKRRATYDARAAASGGRKLVDDTSQSPVHRSQSFHTTNISELVDYSSDEGAVPPEMLNSTHSDYTYRDRHGRKDYRDIRNEYINQSERSKRRDPEKRKTYIVDDTTPTRENVEFLKTNKTDYRSNATDHKYNTIDKRKTFILDSDTNSTTNGSSPRNSSIFSQEKSLTTCTSDTEESGPESAPIVMRHPAGKKSQEKAKNRHSGDFSVSSSTTSINQKKPVQPRYLDISKYKADGSPKNFLRRDPSKTYVAVLGNSDKEKERKGSARQVEMEQKKQELEKWRRRATYDPRKSAAAAAGSRACPGSNIQSNVLRSQSFHGPMLPTTFGSCRTEPNIHECVDASSDNDF